MPKLKIRLKLSKLKFKPKNLLARISKAFINQKSKEMSTPSLGRNRRLTMAELLAEEKMQLQHIYESLSLKEGVDTGDIGEEEEGGGGGSKTVPKQSEKKRRESPGKQSSSAASLSFSNLLRMKTRFCFSKWKTNKTKNVNVEDENIGMIGDDLAKQKSEGSVSGGRNTATGEKVMQREGEVVEQREERDDHVGEKEEESREFELCKRRILMGGKCKPLNVSGTLSYDENGMLLPEEIWTKEG